jgi:hypothetical protein
MSETFRGAARALAEDPATTIEDWLRRYQASPLRVPRPVDLRGLVGPARGIADALGPALAEGAGPGSPGLREAEKLVAFAGGNLGAASNSAFDVAALIQALRDALVARADGEAEREALRHLCDWLAALALEGYASSRLDALRLRHRDSLEKGTPVVLVTRELPAALLVGEPERPVLDATLGRLLLATVRAGARAVIVDGGGLVAPLDPAVLDALAAFGAHPKVGSILTLLSGLPPDAEARWLAAFPRGAAAACERFEDAVARGLQVLREKGIPT